MQKMQNFSGERAQPPPQTPPPVGRGTPHLHTPPHFPRRLRRLDLNPPILKFCLRYCLLGPILFIILINDLVEHVNNGSDLYLYADDAKLFSFIKTMEDSATLQKDLNSLLIDPVDGNLAT